MTEKLPRDDVAETEPAFRLDAGPVDGTRGAAGPRQDNLPVEQGEQVSGREGADDEGGVGPGDQVVTGFGTAERVLVFEEVVGGDGFGGGGCCCGDGGGGIVVVGDGTEAELVEGRHCRGALAR